MYPWKWHKFWRRAHKKWHLADLLLSSNCFQASQSTKQGQFLRYCIIWFTIRPSINRCSRNPFALGRSGRFGVFAFANLIRRKHSRNCLFLARTEVKERNWKSGSKKVSSIMNIKPNMEYCRQPSLQRTRKNYSTMRSWKESTSNILKMLFCYSSRESRKKASKKRRQQQQFEEPLSLQSHIVDDDVELN